MNLAVVVELARRHEPEPPVEPGRPAGPRYVARRQLRRALGPHQLRDLPHDIRAAAAALVPPIDELLPPKTTGP
jgi:hypothetical protein